MGFRTAGMAQAVVLSLRCTPEIVLSALPFPGVRFWPRLAVGCLIFCASAYCEAQMPTVSDQPWPVPATSTTEQAKAVETDRRTTISPNHVYTLPELISLAEEHNPATRAAWAQARVQAGQLGIAQSDLFPALTAVMMTNTTRDGVLFGEAFVRQTLGQYQPMLQVNYLILDFGDRSARIETARQQLLSANLGFNRVQLDVLFETSRRYYRLLDTVGQRDAAQVNFDNADTVRKAVEARLAVGLATLPDALEASAAAAQADFTLQATIGDVDIARGDLLSLLGASPLDPLKVQSLADLVLPTHMEEDAEADVKRALSQRPEIGQQVTARDEARGEIRRAHSAFLPQLQFQGQGGEIRAYGRQDLLNDTYAGPLVEWSVNLNLQWTLFDGGRRLADLERAHAAESQAQANIDETRDQVEQQVWTAYVSLRTAFSQRDAAAVLLAASQTSYEASLQSYHLGLRNTVDLVTAQRTLAQALSSDVAARTQLLTRLANLSYRTGDLLQSAAKKVHP